MANIRKIEIRYPTTMEWDEISASLCLEPQRFSALQRTVAEAVEGCANLDSAISNRKTKAAIGKIDRQLDKLLETLSDPDTGKAIGAVENHGSLGFLLSASAASLVPGYREPELLHAAIKRLLPGDDRSSTLPTPSELDQLSLTDRQRALAPLTLEALQFVLKQIRRPFNYWLLCTSNEKGGQPPKFDRNVLILLLARDAPQIIGVKASWSDGGPFHNLCSHLFPYCGIDTDGLEDSVKRCLKKYYKSLIWNRLPRHAGQVGVLRPEDIDRIADNPEPPLQ